MPIWAMLLSWPMLGARPRPREIAALLLGIAGIAVLFAGHGVALGAGKSNGIALALAAAILFALGSVRTQAPLPLAPIAQVAWQVGLGCAPMVLFGLAVEQPDFSRLSTSGAAVLIYMTLGPMGLCYLTWFAALRRLPASTAALGTLIVPVIGVIAAAMLLGEPLGLREIRRRRADARRRGAGDPPRLISRRDPAPASASLPAAVAFSACAFAARTLCRDVCACSVVTHPAEKAHNGNALRGIASASPLHQGVERID